MRLLALFCAIGSLCAQHGHILSKSRTVPDSPPILISSALEARLRARAAAAGVSVETYLERVAREDQEAEEELEALASEGLRSGDPIEVGPGYWEEKHRRLEERLKKTGNR
ncbi:MAG: hypothetical protein JNN08_32540 [Bryobacterales bacterium]|nr:hypothetical protein [Bryobacterales bacterium]